MNLSHAKTFITLSSASNDKLLTDAKLGDNGTIALNVVLRHIVQQTTALADHLEQTHTAVVVLLVHLQVLGELIDPLGEDRDLHLGGAGIALVGLVVLDNSGFLVLGNHDFLLFLSVLLDPAPE